MLKWPTIAPAWMYGDPQGFADALINRTERLGGRAAQGFVNTPPPAPSVPRDRYYTRARQVRIRQAMKGNR